MAPKHRAKKKASSKTVPAPASGAVLAPVSEAVPAPAPATMASLAPATAPAAGSTTKPVALARVADPRTSFVNVEALSSLEKQPTPSKAEANVPDAASQNDMLAAYKEKFKDEKGKYTSGHEEPKVDGNKITMSFNSDEEAKAFFKEQAEKGVKFTVSDSEGKVLYHSSGKPDNKLVDGPPPELDDDSAPSPK